MNWNGRACGPRHVWKPIWPSRDWIVSWSAVRAWWSERNQIKSNFIMKCDKRTQRLLNVKESTSYYHSSLLEYRFTVWSIKPVTNTSLHDLNVEIGTATKSRVYRTLSWWHVEFVWWRVESTADTWGSFDDAWSSTGETWRPRPRSSPSFYPVNLGRQSLRSGLYAYRVACYRDRRPTSLKDTLLRRIFVSIIRLFCNSLVILISNSFHPQIFVVYFL